MFNFFLEGATNTTAPQNANLFSGFGGIIMLVLMFVVMYFLMIRPQKKQEQEAQKMRDSLAVGDEITTIGGIIGEIVSIKEETVTIETSKAGTKIRFLKSAIRSVDVSAEDKKKAAEGGQN
ncbi:MAG: preprotein translocase subunit YajC [Clostridia bacterium]|nr:preprotein translocase subunit YajC [Clostridia bacterium]